MSKRQPNHGRGQAGTPKVIMAASLPNEANRQPQRCSTVFLYGTDRYHLVTPGLPQASWAVTQESEATTS